MRNGERFISQALDSVVAQTRQASEIVVIDGGSTDATETIVRSYPGVRFVMQTGSGLADAYNSAVASTRGELIAFLSNDDVWLPQKLEKQVAALRADPDAQYVTSHFRVFVEPGSQPAPGFRKETLGRELTGRIMEALLVRRTVFEKVGGFDRAYATANDMDWFKRVSAVGLRKATVPEVLLLKRVHESNHSLCTRAGNVELLQIFQRSIRRSRNLTPERDPG